MKIEDVRQLPSGQRFCYFIRERESIRLKKLAGEAPPFTDDVILQSYRFTNVVRMEDRVSKWLLTHWYKPHFDHPNMVVAVALARFFNKIETLTYLGFPERWRPGLTKRWLRQYRDKGATIFNAAYMVRGNDGVDKIEAVVDKFVHPLHKKPLVINRSSMEKTWGDLKARHGFGSFMAGQVCADLRHAITNQWEDAKLWAPLGPGSKKGLNRLLERPVDTPVNQSEFDVYLSAIMNTYSPELPPELVDRMEAIDWQNCLCETAGYEKVLWGQGRKKQLYDGKGTQCLSSI